MMTWWVLKFENFLKMGQSRPLSYLFSVFQITIQISNNKVELHKFLKV